MQFKFSAPPHKNSIEALKQIYEVSNYHTFVPEPDVAAIENANAFIAYDGDKPTGFIFWSDIRDGYWIEMVGMAVVPDYQGGTLAWRLWRAMTEVASRAGAYSIVAGVHAGNQAVSRYLSRLGAVPYSHNTQTGYTLFHIGINNNGKRR